MSLGGHWAVHMSFGGSLPCVVQWHQQHPHTQNVGLGGLRSRCLDWVLNSGHGILHGTVKIDALHCSTCCLPSFLPFLVLPCIWTCVSTNPLQRIYWKVNCYVVTWWHSNENGFPKNLFFSNVLFTWVKAFVMKSVFSQHQVREVDSLCQKSWCSQINTLQRNKDPS